MSTNRSFFCNKMSTNRAFICNKISSKYLCRLVDIDELRCLRIGTNVVSIRRHRPIGLSTDRDKCGVDSSTSTNRDVYQCGYLRIDLLPFARTRLKCRLHATSRFCVDFEQSLFWRFSKQNRFAVSVKAVDFFFVGIV